MPMGLLISTLDRWLDFTAMMLMDLLANVIGDVGLAVASLHRAKNIMEFQTMFM